MYPLPSKNDCSVSQPISKVCELFPLWVAQVTLTITCTAYAGDAINAGNKAADVNTDNAANRRSFFILVSLP